MLEDHDWLFALKYEATLGKVATPLGDIAIRHSFWKRNTIFSFILYQNRYFIEAGYFYKKEKK